MRSLPSPRLRERVGVRAWRLAGQRRPASRPLILIFSRSREKGRRAAGDGAKAMELNQATGEPAKRARIAAIDAARGGALAGMVVYHLIWDFAHFGLVAPTAPFAPATRALSHVVASAFLALVGVSLALAHPHGLRRDAFLKRLALIAGAAALVTAASYAIDASRADPVRHPALHRRREPDRRAVRRRAALGGVDRRRSRRRRAVRVCQRGVQPAGAGLARARNRGAAHARLAAAAAMGGRRADRARRRAGGVRRGSPAGAGRRGGRRAGPAARSPSPAGTASSSISSTSRSCSACCGASSPRPGSRNATRARPISPPARPPASRTAATPPSAPRPAPASPTAPRPPACRSARRAPAAAANCRRGCATSSRPAASKRGECRIDCRRGFGRAPGAGDEPALEAEPQAVAERRGRACRQSARRRRLPFLAREAARHARLRPGPWPGQTCPAPLAGLIAARERGKRPGNGPAAERETRA